MQITPIGTMPIEMVPSGATPTAMRLGLLPQCPLSRCSWVSVLGESDLAVLGTDHPHLSHLDEPLHSGIQGPRPPPQLCVLNMACFGLPDPWS